MSVGTDTLARPMTESQRAAALRRTEVLLEVTRKCATMTQIDGVLARRAQILQAVLVVNRQRFLGFAAKRRRAPRQHRELGPRFGGFVRPAIPAADPRQAAQRFAVHFRFGADTLRELNRPQQRRFGVLVFAAALVDARQPVGFLRRRRRGRAARDQDDGAGTEG